MEIPHIKIDDGILTISISATELKMIVNNNSDNGFKVTDQDAFLLNFAAQLSEYTTSNSQEMGITALQEFIDTVAGETYINDGDNCTEEITDPE